MKPALARYFNKRGIPIPECEEAWRFGSIEMLRDQLDKEPDYSLEEVSFFCTGLRSVEFCWRNAYKTHHGEHWVQTPRILELKNCSRILLEDPTP